MMQGSTPGPATGAKPAREHAATTVKRAAATAPRTRPSASAVAAAAAAGSEGAGGSAGSSGGGGSSSSIDVARGPVVLVLDGELQALPWESVPGLRSQRWGGRAGDRRQGVRRALGSCSVPLPGAAPLALLALVERPGAAHTSLGGQRVTQ